MATLSLFVLLIVRSLNILQDHLKFLATEPYFLYQLKPNHFGLRTFSSDAN